MEKSKYEKLADNIPELIGGQDNLEHFTHCVTRLRFNVKNRDVVWSLDKIKEIPGVVNAQWSGEQLQIVIGLGVDEAYEVVSKKLTTGVSNHTNGEKVKRKFSISLLLNVFSGCISPIITLLIGTGLIKVILLLGTMSGLVAVDSSTYQVLSFVSDSAFYFLPIFLGYSSAIRFGMNPYLGALLGAMLLHPNFINLVNAGDPINVFGIPIYAVGYSNSIFPIIVTTWIGSYVETIVKKYSPQVFSSILVPFLTVLIMIPLTLCLLAPLGSIAGVYFSNVIIWVYEKVGFIAVALFAVLHPVMTMTGMQGAFAPYMFASLADLGMESLVSPATFVGNINIGVSVLAVALKSRKKEIKTTAISSGFTATVGGITEPALFGTVVQNNRILIAIMLGNLVGGAIAGIFNCVSYAFAGSYGILGLVTFIGDSGMSNFYHIALAVIVGAIVTFVLTLYMYKEEPQKTDVIEAKE